MVTFCALLFSLGCEEYRKLQKVTFNPAPPLSSTSTKTFHQQQMSVAYSWRVQNEVIFDIPLYCSQLARHITRSTLPQGHLLAIQV